MSASKFIAAILAIVLVVLVINGIAVRFAPSPSMHAISIATGTGRGLDLQMHAFVPKNVLRRCEPVPVLLTLTNVSGRPVTGVRLAWIPNGFALDHPLTFAGSLPEHSTNQLRFQIWSKELRGEFSPAMMAWWRDGDGIERWRAVTIGPLRVENVWQTRTIWVARVIQLTVKDLGLPIVLAFLGFWFKKKEDDRAKKDREAAEERSEKDRKAADVRAASDRNAAENRASRQQVFSILLPKSHDDARHFYLPMQGAADMIPKVCDAYVANPQNVNAADELYYQIISFIRRMRHIQLNIGGFHFRSLAGEEVLALSWVGFKRRMDESATKAEIAEVLDLIEDPMLSLAAFNQLVKSATPVKALRNAMLKWIDEQPEKFKEALTFHQLFRIVLGQELNRVYDLWYGRPLEFKSDEWRELIGKLEHLEYFTQELKTYASTYESERISERSSGD